MSQVLEGLSQDTRLPPGIVQRQGHRVCAREGGIVRDSDESSQ